MSTDAITTQLARATLEFSDEQRKLIRDSFANGATDSEFGVLMEVARARRLNPLLQQIHFVKRWNSARRCETWATQVGIDGLRAIAERTGRYDGQDEPEFEYDAKGALKSCKVRIYRKDISRPFVGVAMFAEYVQTKKEGGPNAMWARGPHFMLAKCAEALAFRKGFPEDMAGLYVPEEMGSDNVERELNPAPQLTRPAQPALSAPNPTAPALPSKTEAAKEKIKARMQIVDQRAGETEAEATARTKAEAVKNERQVPLWERVQVMAREYDVEAFTMASVIRGATGKADRTQLVESDLSLIAAALAFRAKQPSDGPPPPDDSHAPAP